MLWHIIDVAIKPSGVAEFDFEVAIVCYRGIRKTNIIIKKELLKIYVRISSNSLRAVAPPCTCLEFLQSRYDTTRASRIGVHCCGNLSKRYQWVGAIVLHGDQPENCFTPILSVAKSHH